MNNIKAKGIALFVGSFAVIGGLGVVGAGVAQAHPGPITGHEIYDSDAECYRDLRSHNETRQWECTRRSDGTYKLEGKTHAQ